MSVDTVQAASRQLVELLRLLREGQVGFRELSERVEDPEFRDFLRQESIMRGIYADQLERSTEIPPRVTSDTGIRPGLFHRQWFALKARLASSDDALLKTAENCEWFAVRAYEETLRDGTIPDQLHDLIASQSRSVLQARKIVQEFRRRRR